LLTATKPGDCERPPSQLVDKVLVTVGTFARSLDTSSSSNPYRTTLRKLWSKLKEKDWRTTLKALFVLHRLLAEVEPEDGVLFKKCLQRMQRETDKKLDPLSNGGKPVKHFSLGPIVDNLVMESSPPQAAAAAARRRRQRSSYDGNNDDDDEGGRDSDEEEEEDDSDEEEDETVVEVAGVLFGSGRLGLAAEAALFKPFAKHYAAYVLKRFGTFTSQFEEMHLIGDGGALSTEDMVATLFKAKKLVEAALLCTVSLEAECGLSVACLELVLADVRRLFTLFDNKLRWLIERQTYLFEGWEEEDVVTLLQSFLDFRVNRFDEVSAFLDGGGALLEIWGCDLAASSVGSCGGGGLGHLEREPGFASKQLLLVAAATSSATAAAAGQAEKDGISSGNGASFQEEGNSANANTDADDNATD